MKTTIAACSGASSGSRSRFCSSPSAFGFSQRIVGTRSCSIATWRIGATASPSTPRDDEGREPCRDPARRHIEVLTPFQAVTFSWRLTVIPLRRVLVIALPGCCLVFAGAAASVHEAGCRVQGVWELESTTNNGKDMTQKGYRQIKIVTQHHFMWIGQASRRDTLPLKTEADTL